MQTIAFTVVACGYMRSSDLLEACWFLAAQIFFASSKAMLRTHNGANCLGQNFCSLQLPQSPPA